MEDENLEKIIYLDLDCLTNDIIYAHERNDKICRECSTNDDNFIPCGDDRCDFRKKITARKIATDSPSNTIVNDYDEKLDDNDRTELHRLAAIGDVERAAEELKKGADPRRKTRGGMPPMYFAVMSGCPHIVRLFIDWGVDVNVVNIPDFHQKLYWPVLHVAVAKDKPKIVQELLHLGANLHRHDSKKYTALHVACDLGSVKIVRLLLSHGAKVNEVTDDGFTIAYLAARYAARYRCGDVFGALCRAKDDLKIFDPRNNPITLNRLASSHYADIVWIYLRERENKMDADALEMVGGDTPLHYVIRASRWLTVISDNERRNNDKNCFLMNSSIVEIVSKFFRLGVDVNAKNLDGDTPLHLLARYFPNKEVLQLFLDHGADVNVTNKSGVTPMRIMLYFLSRPSYKPPNDDVIHLFLAYGANFNHQLTFYRFYGEEKLVSTLFRFRYARKLAGLTDVLDDNVRIDSVIVNDQFKRECSQELDNMSNFTINESNWTLLQFLQANEHQLGLFLSRRHASVVSQIMPEIERRYKIYGLMLRRNFTIGRRYARIVKKAAAIFYDVHESRLLFELSLKIMVKLDYSDVKSLIKAFNNFKCTKTK